MTAPWRRLPSLLYRGFPNLRAASVRTPTELEVGDTADLEICATPERA